MILQVNPAVVVSCLVQLRVVVRDGTLPLTCPPILHLHMQLLDHWVFKKVASLQPLRDLSDSLGSSTLDIIGCQVHA